MATFPRLIPLGIMHLGVSMQSLVRSTREGMRTPYRQMQQFVQSKQQSDVAAAAFIEAPLGVRPHQRYILLVRITGRDNAREYCGGLSAFSVGEVVHLEVQATISPQNSCVVAQTDVEIPGDGYSAVVKIPMQSFTHEPQAQRERLRIYFMDILHRSLYDKPFAVELFISPLVPPGAEGRNILRIPR